MSRLADWVAEVLETDEEIRVPVKKLWKTHRAQNPNISLAELQLELEGDPRFEIMGGSDPAERFEGWSEDEISEYQDEMESRGYFKSPHVKLKTRNLAAEHISRMIAKHTDRLMQSLWSAYDARPEDLNKAPEQELLDIIVRAKRFQLDANDASQPREGKKLGLSKKRRTAPSLSRSA